MAKTTTTKATTDSYHIVGISKEEMIKEVANISAAMDTLYADYQLELSVRPTPPQQTEAGKDAGPGGYELFWRTVKQETK